MYHLIRAAAREARAAHRGARRRGRLVTQADVARDPLAAAHELHVDLGERDIGRVGLVCHIGDMV